MIPSGTYERVDKDGRTVTVSGTYQQVEKHRLGPQWLLTSPLKGFVDGALIISFLFVIGGAFAIIQETGSIDFAIRRITAALTHHPSLEKLTIPVLMVIFSLAGSVFGMSEETIPFVLIFVPLAISLGYDSIVGVSIPFLGAAAGFAAAFFNPFTVGVAQGLVGSAALLRAGLPRHHLVHRDGRDRRHGSWSTRRRSRRTRRPARSTNWTVRARSRPTRKAARCRPGRRATPLSCRSSRLRWCCWSGGF